jgi:hypothetical protein
MVRSDRTTARFFHQRVGERAESLQERLSLVRRKCCEGLLQRAVSPVEPCTDGRRGLLVELDDRAAAVVRILAAADEAVVLELGRQLARRGEGEAETARELPDGLSLARPDLREDGDVPAADPRRSPDEAVELGRGPPACPEAAQHLPEEAAELVQLIVVGPAGNTQLLIKVIL